MKRIRFLTGLSLAVVGVAAVAACGSGEQTVPSSAVAVCGDQAISKEQFDRLVNQARSSYKSQKRAFPKAGSQEYTALRGQAMQFLVQRCQFEQKAEDLDLDITDEDVEKRLTEIKKQYFGGSEKKFLEQIKKQGLKEDQVRDDVRSQVIQEKIYNMVTKGVTVSDADIAAYYKKNKTQYEQPASRDVRHILVKKKALADSLYAQLKAGADFAKLAKQYTQDTSSKKQGGKLTVSKGSTVPPFDKQAFALSVHEISVPVKTQYGWHIIEPLTVVKAKKTTPISQVKDSIRQQLLQQKKQEKMTEWVNQVKKDFESKLKYQIGFEPPATSTTGTPTPQQ